MELQLSPLDLSLDRLIKDSEFMRFFDSRLAFRLHRCLSVLEGSDLGLELFVELPHCLLFTYGIHVVEGHLLSFVIWVCCSFICYFMSASI